MSRPNRTTKPTSFRIHLLLTYSVWITAAWRTLPHQVQKTNQEQPDCESLHLFRQITLSLVPHVSRFLRDEHYPSPYWPDTIKFLSSSFLLHRSISGRHSGGWQCRSITSLRSTSDASAVHSTAPRCMVSCRGWTRSTPWPMTARDLSGGSRRMRATPPIFVLTPKMIACFSTCRCGNRSRH